MSTPTFDPGPPSAVAQHFAALPSYAAHAGLFWYDWGPILYRGRLNGAARVLCLASDPGPTERVAHRTLVGDAGQRVQGFLTKLGLTSSYVCVNAYAYALLPSKASRAQQDVLPLPEQVAWREKLLALITGPKLQAVVAFGGQAQGALDLWAGLPAGVHVERVPHPSSRSASALLSAWRDAVPRLRAVVTPDADGAAGLALPNYGTSFRESDYAPIPRGDLPFGVPSFLGDDAWGRKAKPRHNNGVSRPSKDLLHTIEWIAPRS
ncbi:hypothetical protein ACFT5B_03205 [Luteimicrobium sp. NPDC057192]|uniref:hypothetical protein n=1 Tax=Luteimicrobium sp. NPDC057192 TaxID=3346042 RepID=UPI00363113B2